MAIMRSRSAISIMAFFLIAHGALGMRTMPGKKLMASQAGSWPPPAILSGTNGYKRCIGVSRADLRSKDKLRSLGCPIVEHADGTWETAAPSRLAVSVMCGRLAPKYMDGFPVTFNYPMITEGVDRKDFVLTLSDGSQIFPFCFNMAPANEMNEMMTPLFVLDGVSSKGLDIVRFEVVGDVGLLRPDGEVVNARGLAYEGPKLHYQNTGPSLVWGSLSVFSTARETNASRTNPAYPNHCRVHFPDTTHVLKLVMDGGSTKDGITGLGPQDTNYFEVKLPDGQNFPKTGTLLGLADLGNNAEAHDGDNFFDLCFKLDHDDLVELRWQGGSLTSAAVCGDDTKLYYPKGDCYGACGDAACRRSEIQIQSELGPLASLENTAEEQIRAEATWRERFDNLDGDWHGDSEDVYDCSRVEGALWRNSAWRRKVECKCPADSVIMGDSEPCKAKAANFDRYFDADSTLGRDGKCRCGIPTN